MLNRLEELRLRISLIIKKDRFTFINTPFEFSNKLYKYFGQTYNEDEIENVLNELEDELIEKQVSDEVIQIPEDFEI